jgi:Trk-type K+ transport system membrane component
MISEMTTETTRIVDKVTTETTWGVDKAIAIAVSVLAVCGVVLIVVLFWLRKHRAGNGKQ